MDSQKEYEEQNKKAFKEGVSGTPAPSSGGGPRKRGSVLRRIMDLILIIIILILALYLYQGPFQEWKKARAEEKLRQVADHEITTEAVTETADETVAEGTEAETAEASYDSPIDFEALRKINPDIVAWLRIPGTKIDYPVVQTTDNETYLKKTFEGGQSVEGTVYLDCDSDSDSMGYHSIFYGHNMKNKTMFADIVKFKDKEFFSQHREIILYTPEREMHLKTIAALYGDADGEKRRTKFKSQEAFDQYIDTMTSGCSFRDMPGKGTERLYSFVTCSYEFENARTILYAVEEED